ncbi:uncharacterized protein LOC122668544 [Telopea speciosissima]|uniref:uncharacterized protein LOC122668544 n=1 Tax=Telopea speciosissima TaxID=54955 RepID=UPI001CC75447|nr:uncharacterized protein LOC122668544 [Telopea speciosissima]
MKMRGNIVKERNASLYVVLRTEPFTEDEKRTENTPEREEKQKMIEGRGAAAPPHGVLLAVVVGIVVGVPMLVGEQGEAITGAIAELLTPMGLLLVPIVLLLVIQFLSSDRGSVLSGIFSTGEPDSIHRLSGSPVGVALFLILLIFLLYNRVSLFGSDDDGE